MQELNVKEILNRIEDINQQIDMAQFGINRKTQDEVIEINEMLKPLVAEKSRLEFKLRQLETD